jgi:hypothetical protein
MTVRTLAEAAAEVLMKSKSAASQETSNLKANPVIDLGGSTYEDPSGGDVGKKAAAARSQMTPPKGPSVGSEAMKKLAPQPQNSVSGETSPPNGTKSGSPSATAGHGLAQPVSEEEVVEDEVIAEEEDSELVSEEETEEAYELSEEEIADALEAKKQWMMEKMKSMGSEDDIDALFNGEELSEEFREKATTIFEAAVIARAIPVIEELETEILAAAEDLIEETKKELEEQVDAYLGYMVEEWVKENSVAIESGLKAEIVESFIGKLKNVFEEHYIDLPEEKVDVVEAMAIEIDELNKKLNESLNANIDLARAITEARKAEITVSVCEGLTATQAEKVKTLAEGVEFTTEGDYTKKMGIIRENYFASDNKAKVNAAAKNLIALSEEAPAEVTEEISSTMAGYLRAISRTLPK